MIRLPRKNRTSRLRAIRAYLLIILVCTLLLFCFSLISLSGQREKVKELSSSNLRLMGEQLALDIQGRMEVLAADCLNAQTMKLLLNATAQKDSFEYLQDYRQYFNTLAKTHPIAQHFFVFSGTRLLFPLLQAPPPQTLRSLMPAKLSQSFQRFLQLLEQGDNLDIRLHRPDEAIPIYQSAQMLDVGDRLKALALFRKARALQKANRQTAAVETYQKLVTLYGDQYNESRIPYVLYLAASSEAWTERIFPSTSQFLHEIYKDLIGGKWELSFDQTQYYLDKLEQRLHLISSRSPKHSDFMDHFHLAKAVSWRSAIEQARTTPSEIIARAIEYGDKHYQTYRISMPGDKGLSYTVGFSVSMPWIIDSLIPEVAEESQYGNMGTISLVENSQSTDKELPGKNIYVSFRTILPSWKLRLSAETMRLSEIAASRELWFAGLSMLMLLCILSLGLFLFIRVSWDIRWFQLRSDFVSGVSHEFKTPLSLIRLYSETLAIDDQDFSPDDRRNYSRIIARESERMSRLMDNVLDFSKMEQGRRLHVLQEGDLTAPISQAVNDYSEYLAWSGFAIKCSIQPQLPPVRFNSEQVSQMLLNLMDNARKYSGTSKLIRVNAWAEFSEVVVEVQDNGIGIPAEEKEKIFQPFYRVAKGNEKGGCGLGLYLVDQVMREHGGRVEVESEVNQGSRFRLVFPISGSKRERIKKQKGHVFTRFRSHGQVQDYYE